MDFNLSAGQFYRMYFNIYFLKKNDKCNLVWKVLKNHLILHSLFFESSAYSKVYLPFTSIMCLCRCYNNYRYSSQKALLCAIFFHLFYIIIMNVSHKMCPKYGNLVICTSSRNFGLIYFKIHNFKTKGKCFPASHSQLWEVVLISVS